MMTRDEWDQLTPEQQQAKEAETLAGLTRVANEEPPARPHCSFIGYDHGDLGRIVAAFEAKYHCRPLCTLCRPDQAAKVGKVFQGIPVHSSTSAGYGYMLELPAEANREG